MILVVAAWVAIALTFYSLFRRGRHITSLFREIKNPPYPITAEETQQMIREYGYNPTQAFPLLLKTLIRQQKILWSHYPSSKETELNIAVRDARKLFIRGTLVFLVFVSLIVTVFVWAASNGKTTAS